MKWLLRTIVFGLTLIGGYWAAIFIDLSAYQAQSISIDGVEDFRRAALIADTGVQVTYRGWERGTADFPTHLKVQVRNDSWQPYAYTAFNAGDLVPKISVNGQEVERILDCGTGLGTLYLMPGESAEIKVMVYEFTGRVRQDDTVTVGFYLRRPFDEQYRLYRSEPSGLPAEFLTAIDQNIKNYGLN
jgi:hypothetical protein